MGYRVTRGIWLVGLMLVMLAAFADNKERIAFQIDRGPSSNITVMYSDYSHPQDLITHKDVSGKRLTPALSPDGYTLAFSAKVGNHYKIFTWALDDQNKTIGPPTQLSPDDPTHDKFPSWSPDGKQLAYLATDDTGKTHLRVISSDGSEKKDLGEAWFATPAWSPDGQFILFVNLENKKPVLKRIMTTDGQVSTLGVKNQPIPAIAACYSPDGTQIAALVKVTDTLAELKLIVYPGVRTTVIAQKIVDCKSICWPQPDHIIFNASKVNGQSGRSFWSINPKSKAISGASSFNDPKHTSFFTVQRSIATADIPPSVVTSGKLGPDATTGAGTGERAPNGAVTIIRPLAGEVRGVVPIKVVATKEVASVTLRLKSQTQDQFLFAGTIQSSGETGPQISFIWNTQELLTVDPRKDKMLPARYQSALSYPDDDYIITATGLDANNKPVGDKDSIKVTVKNGLPDTSMPGNLYLHYQYRESEQETEYTVHGDGMAYGADPQSQGSLFASLNAVKIHHALVEQRQDGRYDIRAELRASTDLPLQFGLYEAGIPEMDVSALYSVAPTGALEVVPQQREKIYLPLAQLFVPFPTETEQRDQMTVGHQWSADMWIVGDLLERKAIHCDKALHTLEGLEWIGNQHVVRIRSEFQLDPASSTLSLAPINVAPSLKDTQPPLSALPVNAARGVRYSWFDYDRDRLVRVEDMIIYEFPLYDAAVGVAAAPAPAPPAAGGAAGTTPPAGDQPPATAPAATPPVITPLKHGNGTGYYVVRYSYYLAVDDSAENK